MVVTLLMLYFTPLNIPIVLCVFSLFSVIIAKSIFIRFKIFAQSIFFCAKLFTFQVATFIIIINTSLFLFRRQCR